MKQAKAKSKRVLILPLLFLAALATFAWIWSISNRNTFTYYRYDASLATMEIHHKLVNSIDGWKTAEQVVSSGETSSGSTFLNSGHTMTLGDGTIYVYKRYLDEEWESYEQLSIYVQYGQDKNTFHIPENTSGIMAFYTTGQVEGRASNCFGYPSSGNIVIHDKGLLGSRTLDLNLSIPTKRLSGSEIVPCRLKTYKEKVRFKLDGCCV
jgi:hypothetical protein